MKKLFALAGVILLAIGVIGVLIYTKINKSYSEIINMNWSIKVPNSYKEVYYRNSEASFQGDGERYHIFEYSNDNDVIKALDWENGKDTTMQLEVMEIFKTLRISEEYMPNFESEYKYYTKTKKDSSKIYFIFIDDTKKLYIIENII